MGKYLLLFGIYVLKSACIRIFLTVLGDKKNVIFRLVSSGIFFCEIYVFTLSTRQPFSTLNTASISSFSCAGVSAAQRDLLGNWGSYRKSEKERFQSGILSWYLAGYVFNIYAVN